MAGQRKSAIGKTLASHIAEPWFPKYCQEWSLCTANVAPKSQNKKEKKKQHGRGSEGMPLRRDS